jgi:translation initiation factor 4B
LQLIPRSKPLEESAATPAATSAIFGGAKPVDTASKEKEIEQKLLKEKEENDRKRETAANAGLNPNERIRRISAGSNVSGTSRSRKGSDSGPSLPHREDSRDFDDSYRNNGMHRNSFNRQRKTSDRSTNSSDNAPKYIMTRGKDSSQGSRYLPLNQRPQGGGGRGAINSGSNRYNNNNRRRDRDRDRDERFDQQKPPRLQNKSDEEEEKKVVSVLI